MSNNRAYYNTSNRQNGAYDTTDGGILSSINNSVYFYTLCAVGALVVFYIVFYVLRQYEYKWAYGPTLNKIASYMPGIKQNTTST